MENQLQRAHVQERTADHTHLCVGPVTVVFNRLVRTKTFLGWTLHGSNDSKETRGSVISKFIGKVADGETGSRNFIPEKGSIEASPLFRSETSTSIHYVVSTVSKEVSSRFGELSFPQEFGVKVSSRPIQSKKKDSDGHSPEDNQTCRGGQTSFGKKTTLRC